MTSKEGDFRQPFQDTDESTLAKEEIKLRKQVQTLFTDRGLEIATSEETVEERINRIASEIMAGERTLEGVGSALDEFVAPIVDTGTGDLVTTPPEDASPAPGFCADPDSS